MHPSEPGTRTRFAHPKKNHSHNHYHVIASLASSVVITRLSPPLSSHASPIKPSPPARARVYETPRSKQRDLVIGPRGGKRKRETVHFASWPCFHPRPSLCIRFAPRHVSWSLLPSRSKEPAVWSLMTKILVEIDFLRPSRPVLEAREPPKPQPAFPCPTRAATTIPTRRLVLCNPVQAEGYFPEGYRKSRKRVCQSSPIQDQAHHIHHTKIGKGKRNSSILAKIMKQNRVAK